ncbi:hypothetical protein M0804_007599 [Polistes exclamans]|nr:hypothetical protein M0804_007599 [Polistes exclamans]
MFVIEEEFFDRRREQSVYDSCIPNDCGLYWSGLDWSGLVWSGGRRKMRIYIPRVYYSRACATIPERKVGSLPKHHCYASECPSTWKQPRKVARANGCTLTRPRAAAAPCQTNLLAPNGHPF